MPASLPAIHDADADAVPLPALPADVAAKIEALSCGPRMKRTLARIADGAPYREAAAAEGYADHRDAYRWAKRAGLLDTHSARLMAGFRRLVDLTSGELERRLVEAPHDIGTKDLAVVAGIASDKLARFERWGQGASDDAAGGDRWAHVVETLLERGGATLSVTIEPASPDAAAPRFRDGDAPR